MYYFDHNATTFLAPEVAETLSAAVRECYGNASSIHREGQRARQQLEQARNTIAKFLGGSAGEVVFTSGGTEANNLAILGLVRNLPGERKHVVTSAIEHPCVLESCRQLEREGVSITYAAVGPDGAVNVAEIARHIRQETVLVSLMHANNETGAIQPVAEVAPVVEERRKAGQCIYLHSDGVQAFGKLPVHVADLGLDLYAVSAHKIFGPKGVGALYVRKGVPLRGIQLGGRHERERRAGTENVPGAVAFARAIELCERDSQMDVAGLRDSFEREIKSAIHEVEVNAAGVQRLPNTSNLLFRGVSGESLVIALDMAGMAVSSGSACSSGSVEPSHVLLAMGRSRQEARSSVRFSFGRYNTTRELNALVEAVSASVARLRKSAGKESLLAV